MVWKRAREQCGGKNESTTYKLVHFSIQTLKSNPQLHGDLLVAYSQGTNTNVIYTSKRRRPHQRIGANDHIVTLDATHKHFVPLPHIIASHTGNSQQSSNL